MPENLFPCLAAAVHKGDRVWYMGALHEVLEVHNATPKDGTVTWRLQDVPEPVAISAIRHVHLERA
jgi:hypothetical protein